MQIPENLHEGGNSPSRRDGLLPPLAQIIFFEGGFRQTKCHVLAQTQGYHLVCIWGSLVKFQGGGVVVKTMLCARVQIRWVFLPGLTSLPVSLKLRGGSVWLGVMLLHRHRAIIWYAFGVAWLNSRGVGLL